MRERERQTELCAFNIARKSKARVKPEEQYQENAKQAQRQIAPNNSKMQKKCKANTKAEKNANTNTKTIQGEKNANMKCKKNAMQKNANPKCKKNATTHDVRQG